MLSPQYSTWSSIKFPLNFSELNILESYLSDKNPNKVNLSLGTYRDKNGSPYILECVKEARSQYSKMNVNHEYLPISGLPGFIKESLLLGYGYDSHPLKKKCICGIQCLSGTYALKIGMKFLKRFYKGNKTIYISHPTWTNHYYLSRHAGLNVKFYKYYDFENKKIDFDGLINDMIKAPNHSIFLFQICGHNPTGTDLNIDQWKEILEIIKKKNHLPFFDMAYQGLASSDPEKDAFALRMFSNFGFDLCLTQSFTTNFNLYNEKIGCLSFVTKNENEANAIKSQINIICRNENSNPPKFSAYLIYLILSNQTLKKDWIKDIKFMSCRISKMRDRFCDEIKKKGNENDWEFIKEQKGLFGFIGLNKNMIKELKDKFHVYVKESGRINCAALNEGNIEYVANAFNEVTKGAKI